MSKFSSISTPALEPADLIRHSQCPACDSDKLSKAEKIKFRDVTLTYELCGNCELMFMNPMPSQDWYNQFYAKEFWEGKGAAPDMKEPVIQEAQCRKEIQRARQLVRFMSKNDRLPQKGSRILEIGCAFGALGKSIAVRVDGISFGVEPSDIARAFAEKYSGVSIVARNSNEFLKWRPKKPMDLVIMSHVLENIVDPLGLLKQIGTILNHDGQVLIDTPNPIFQKSVSIYHPYVFSHDGLVYFLQRAGFSVTGYGISGRPKNWIIPRYQRFLAILAESGKTGIKPRNGNLVPYRVRRYLGRLFCRALVDLDMALLNAGSKPDETDQKTLNSILSSLKRESSASENRVT